MFEIRKVKSMKNICKTKQVLAFMLVLCSLFLTFAITISASATEEPSIYKDGERAYKNYNVSGTDGKKTSSFCNHELNDPDFWVWAKEPSDDRDKVVHKSVLWNSKDEVRSDTILTYEGTKNRGGSSCTYLKCYYMYLTRQYTYDNYMTLSGTWGYVKDSGHI